MKIFPHQANSTQRSLQAALRDNELSRDKYDGAMAHLVHAVQDFPRSYTLGSVKGPTLLNQGVNNALRLFSFLDAETREAPKLTCDRNVFSQVLSRAADQAENLRGAGASQQDLQGIQVETENVPMANRTANHAPRAEIFCDIRRTSIKRLEAGRPLGTQAAAAATYPGEELATLTLATCAVGTHAADSAFARESRWMAESLAAGIDQMVHGAIMSLLVPRSLMEARAAAKRAFSVDWIMHMERALGVAFPSEEYQSDAAVLLLSAISYRKHLFVANAGTNRAFLWKDGNLKALSVAHRSDQKHEGARHKKLDWGTRLFLSNVRVARALVKSSTVSSSRPQVACLPLREVYGGTLLLLSSGVAEAVGMATLRATLADTSQADRFATLARLARDAGLKDDIVAVSAKISNVDVDR